jgi:hypothetical protein
MEGVKKMNRIKRINQLYDMGNIKKYDDNYCIIIKKEHEKKIENLIDSLGYELIGIDYLENDQIAVFWKQCEK